MRLYFRGHRIRLSQKRQAIIARRVIALALILSLTVLVTTSLYNKAAPIAAENAQTLAWGKWEALASKAVETAMTKGQYNYDSFAAPQTDGNGKIVGIAVNSRNISSIRSSVTQTLNDLLAQNNRIQISVPVGSLVAPRFLNGKGFGIRLNAFAYTAVSVTVISEIFSVGINQTMHRISVRITTDTSLYCMNQKTDFTHTYTTILAESLSFASVPNAYVEYGG